MAKFASKKEIREGIGYESLISHGGLRRFAALPLLPQPSLQTTVEQGRSHAHTAGLDTLPEQAARYGERIRERSVRAVCCKSIPSNCGLAFPWSKDSPVRPENKTASDCAQESPMKTIGMVGGMRWKSSAEYYRLINQQVKARLGH